MNEKDNNETQIKIQNSQVGVLGDHATIEGGLHFLTPENVTMIVSMITAAIGVTNGVKSTVDP